MDVCKPDVCVVRMVWRVGDGVLSTKPGEELGVMVMATHGNDGVTEELG